MKKRKIVYVEPADYFPKEIREEYKLGEYAEKNEICDKKVDNDKHNLVSKRAQ